MPRLTLHVREDTAADMRGMFGLLVDMVSGPADVDAISDEVLANMHELAPAALLAMADATTVLRVLISSEVRTRGDDLDALQQAAVDADEATWTEAPHAPAST